MSSDLRTPTKPTHAANPGSTRNDDALVRPTVSLPPTPQEKVEPARPSTHEATQVTEVGSGSFPLSRSGSGTGALQYSTSSRSNVKLQILSTFGLDQAEVLLDEFRCFNFRSKVPIQGRLYITQFHVCFYSNLLNLEHKLVIRAKDILNISRRDDRAIVLELAPTAGRKQVWQNLSSHEAWCRICTDSIDLLCVCCVPSDRGTLSLLQSPNSGRSSRFPRTARYFQSKGVTQHDRTQQRCPRPRRRKTRD